MFKIKFIAKGSSRSKRPYVTREDFQETSNKSVDEYVGEELKKALFHHGFKDVVVVIQRIDEMKVLHPYETLKVKLNGGRR